MTRRRIGPPEAVRRAGRLGARGAVGSVPLLVVVALLAPQAAATALPRRPHPHRKPWPITVTVQTVPVLSGVRFSWDGVVLVTDAAGRATVTGEHNFSTHSLAALNQVINTSDRRYRFVRWAGERDPQQAFRATVTGLPQRANYTITAGYSVQYPVSARFVDGRRRPVDPLRIGAASVRTDTGADVALPTAGVIWLDGLVPKHTGNGLQARSVTYSVQSVIVNGGNTVDQGQQRFSPADGRPLVITTKFFDLTIRGHDLLRRAPAGSSARVTFPDGSVRTVRFDDAGTAVLSAVPRGRYLVDLQDAGSALSEQVDLSRDAAIDIPAATRGNVVALALLGLGLAVGLVALGGRRRGLLRALTGKAGRTARTRVHRLARRVLRRPEVAS